MPVWRDRATFVLGPPSVSSPPERTKHAVRVVGIPRERGRRRRGPLASTNWMEEPTSRPSQFVSIGSQVATLAYHFKIRRGQPIVTILQEVEQKLGLEAGELRLFERSANAYDAVYATDLPSRPRSAESERSRTNTWLLRHHTSGRQQWRQRRQQQWRRTSELSELAAGAPAGLSDLALSQSPTKKSRSSRACPSCSTCPLATSCTHHAKCSRKQLHD